jgi:hypothetical protein
MKKLYVFIPGIDRFVDTKEILLVGPWFSQLLLSRALHLLHPFVSWPLAAHPFQE